jgi:parvulin-like peptidyl-prolyl isomerase
VVKTPLGYHVFKVVDKLESKQKSFYDANPLIEEILYRDKIQAKMEKFLKDIKEKAYIEHT